MKHISFTCLLFVLAGLLHGQNPPFGDDKDNIQKVKHVVESFVLAGENQDSEAYSSLFHPDFRVLAHQYPTPDKTSVIPAAQYISLIEEKVIGGHHYDIDYEEISFTGATCTVIAHFKSETLLQHVSIFLVQGESGTWTMISELVLQES